MQIRLNRPAVGITDPDQLDPISGKRILLVTENDDAGNPTGVSIVVELEPAMIEHLHQQTSPIVRTDPAEARRLLDEAVPASPELELEQKRRSRRLGRRGA